MSGEDVCAAVFLHFYDNTGARVQHNLPEASSIQFTDALAADGVASFSAPLLAPALQAAPDMLEDGLCKAAMVLTAGAAPTEVFAWELIPTSGNASGELIDRKVQSSGPGWRHIFTRDLVRPEVGGFDSPTDDARVFGWMSGQDSLWYISGDWSAPTSLGPRGAGQAYPDPTAQIITAYTTPAVGEVHLFRGTFTLTATTRVRVYYNFDDIGRIYLNSQLAGDQTGTNFGSAGKPFYFDATLAAGPHTIGAEGTNTIPSNLTFTCSVMRLNADGTNGAVLLRTDTTHWLAHRVTGTRPGWTAAGIFLKLLAEGQADGVAGLSLFTPDFTATHDSAGTAWPDVQEKSWPIATTSLADVLKELEELALDLRIKPDGTVQAFLAQGTDVSATVWFQHGVNLLSLSYQGSPVQATTALVRSLQGWSTVVNSAAVATYGKRYIGISSGVSASLAQGTVVGTQALGELARPRYTYTAVIKATTGAVPFHDFAVGDTVKCPDRKGVMTSFRVLSLSLATPADAPSPVTFTVELDLP